MIAAKGLGAGARKKKCDRQERNKDKEKLACASVICYVVTVTKRITCQFIRREMKKFYRGDQDQAFS